MITGTNFSKKIRGATRVRATALTLLAYSYMRRVDNGSALRRSLLPTGVRFALESPFTVLPCRNHTACGSLKVHLLRYSSFSSVYTCSIYEKLAFVKSFFIFFKINAALFQKHD